MRIIKKAIMFLFIFISLICIKQNFKVEKIKIYNDVKLAETYINEYYYISDLDVLLNDDKKEIIDIKINEKSVLTKDYLEKIKESKKTVNFNYYDNNDTLLYSIIIDGKKVTKTFDFDLSLSYDSEYKDKIYNLDSNNYDEYIHFNYINVPVDSKLKLYVEDDFNDVDALNIYYYDDVKNEINELLSDVEIKDGYVSFELNKYTDYLLSKQVYTDEEEQEIDIPYEMTPLITTVITVIIIIAIISVRLFKYVKENKK